ncbi:MAG: site-2 protease family protein [Oscillospiraceae bacterium]|nr:site-2 protease family protein [Oscillospiraceae bacterium]
MEFSVLGLKIKTNFLNLALIVCAVILSDASGFTGFWVFLAIVLHETAHLLTLCIFKCQPKEIRFATFDVVIVEKNFVQRSFLKDTLIYISGPLANIFFAFFILFLHKIFNFQILLEIFLINITLGCFNLLPIVFLDGGKILKLLLEFKFNPRKSKNILVATSIISIVPLLLTGIIGVCSNSFNFSLLFLSIYLVIMLLIKKIE